MNSGKAEQEAEETARSAKYNQSLKERLMQAYDFDMIKWISEDQPNPPATTPGVHARIMKIQPFSIAARKKFHIDDKECESYGEISPT